jgi:uncharacterized protein (TIGR03000 family)
LASSGISSGNLQPLIRILHERHSPCITEIAQTLRILMREGGDSLAIRRLRVLSHRLTAVTVLKSHGALATLLSFKECRLMKRNVLLAGAIVACIAVLVFAVSPVLAGPPSGGRSIGANTWEAKHSTYAAPAYAVPASVAVAAPAINGGYYYDPDSGNAAVLNVRVPANAEIWLNDYKTKLTGSAREFVSPPLSRDMAYRYHVRVRWMENGHEIVQERDIPVAPATRTTVQFAGLN